MLTMRSRPLAIAATVLSPAMIEQVRREPINRFGWQILDRWAYNTPEKLRALEGQGDIVLLNRLLHQQRLETDALTCPGSGHLSVAERLQTYEIEPEL